MPEHCVFDHRHGGQCFDYMHWNETAFEACWGQGMRTDSFAMLQPCLPDADKFNGVEFVCCPVSDNQGLLLFLPPSPPPPMLTPMAGVL